MRRAGTRPCRWCRRRRSRRGRGCRRLAPHQCRRTGRRARTRCRWRGGTRRCRWCRRRRSRRAPGCRRRLPTPRRWARRAQVPGAVGGAEDGDVGGAVAVVVAGHRDVAVLCPRRPPSGWPCARTSRRWRAGRPTCRWCRCRRSRRADRRPVAPSARCGRCAGPGRRLRRSCSTAPGVPAGPKRQVDGAAGAQAGGEVDPGEAPAAVGVEPEDLAAGEVGEEVLALVARPARRRWARRRRR